MPNFHAGHYFLTVLAPVKLGMSTVAGKPGFSYRQTVLDQLAGLKNSETSGKSRATSDESPFARNTMTHFARFALIDAPPYGGREGGDTLLSKVFSNGKAVLGRCFGIGEFPEQTADSFGVPYLLFAADFDAANGEDASLRKFTDTLWDTIKAELQPIFSQCYGFETVADAASFFNYVKKCQVETTMPFNDYWRPSAEAQLGKMELSLPLPGGLSSSSGGVNSPWLQIGIAGLGLWLACLIASLFLREGTQALHVTNWVTRWGLVAIVVLILVVALFLLSTYRKIMKAGAQAFPIGATLPDVLKSTYLQQCFLDFVVANQGKSDADLQAAFGRFVADHSPDNEQAPTQRPGVIRS